MDKLRSWFKDTSFYYWIVLVIWPSIKASFSISEVGGKIIDIFIALVVSYILVSFFGFTFQTQNLSANFVTLLVLLTVTFLLRLIGNIFYSPAKMYKELGGLVDNPFVLDVYHSKRERKENEDKWASLEVKNSSVSEHIEDCFLKLSDIIDLKTEKSIMEDVQNLTWSGKEQNKEISGNQPIRIIANHEAVCDIARTALEYVWEGPAFFTTWFGNQKIDIGQYRLIIILYGSFQKHPVHYKYQTDLKFEGGNKISVSKPVLVQMK